MQLHRKSAFPVVQLAIGQLLILSMDPMEGMYIYYSSNIVTLLGFGAFAYETIVFLLAALLFKFVGGFFFLPLDCSQKL